MPNNFCRHISNTLYFQTNSGGQITVSPCCYFGNKSVVKSLNDIKIYQKSIEHIRDYSSNQCNVCRTKESALYANQSLRQQSFQLINEHDQGIVSIFLQIDNRCNAACIMCSDDYSTQWQTLNSKINSKYQIVDTSKQTDNFIDNVLAKLDLSNLREIVVLGGEPFYSPMHKTVLDLIPHPENVMLKYITNASIFPDDTVIQHWKKFRKVLTIISIDDIGQRYEYVRWPLKWHQVDNNIKHYIKLQSEINSIVRIQCTLNPLTVYYFNEMEKYVCETFGVNDPYIDKTLILDQATWTKVSLDHISPKLQFAVYDKFGKDHKVSQMIKSLKFNQDYNVMLQWLAIQEQTRNTKSWQEIFPDIVQYLT